jgi:cellulose synthase/poly-beta-1,6-N-acetylglucosamine synthase-like glycosyltransferase
MIITIFTILACIVFFFLVFPFVMVFLGQFFKEKLIQSTNSKNFDYGVIITAYKNSEITKPLVQSLLRMHYDNFHIYLVADECDVSGYDFQHEKFTLLKPEPSLKLKAKSIIFAVEKFVRNHDYVVVFDGDNLAHPNFLTEINKYANNGYTAIQGQRTAKNLDTTFASADSLGEFYKNYIERYIPYLLGSSTVISGSGMAIEDKLYKSYLYGDDITQGKEQWKKMLQEDKILQNHILRANGKIVYAKNAIVYDEKVVDGTGVETQRGRWLFSYFQNLPNTLGILRRSITNFSWNQLVFGLMTITPPMFILLLLAIFVFFIGLICNTFTSLLMMIGCIIFVLNILWTLKLSNAPKEVWNAVWAMPNFVIRQIKGLLKMGNPNKNFKHSEHTRKINIDDLLNK